MAFSYTAAILMSLSIFIAGIIGIFRFAQIDNKYRPFIYLIWIGCFNEALSIYLASTGHYTIINSVLYSLCESLFLLWFFKKQGIFNNRKNLFYFLIGFLFVIWFIESFFRKSFGSNFTYYFNVVYYFIVVLFSIRVINDLLFTEKELLQSPIFWICIGLILFFTYGIMVRIFWLNGLKSSTAFISFVQSINILINFLTNLIFALAVAFMRKRQAFAFEF
jgi:hypothetical protein